MGIADLTQPLQIADRRRNHPGRARHRLDDHRCYVGGIVQCDQLQQLLGSLCASLRHAAGEGVFRQQSVGQMIGVDPLAEQGAVSADAAQADAAEVYAVIALHAAEQLGLGGLALLAPVGAGDLQRGVGTLGAGAGEKHLIETWRGHLTQAIGELEGLGMAELEGRRVVELAQLAADCFGDFRAAVACAAGPQAGEAIENLATFGVGEVAALGADDDARVTLELAVAGIGHPVGIQLCRAEPGGGR